MGPALLLAGSSLRRFWPPTFLEPAPAEMRRDIIYLKNYSGLKIGLPRQLFNFARTIFVRVIRSLAQGHVGYVCDGGAHMHARALTTHAVHPVLAVPGLKTDADVAAMTILAYTVVLRNFPSTS